MFTQICTILGRMVIALTVYLMMVIVLSFFGVGHYIIWFFCSIFIVPAYKWIMKGTL